MGALSADAGHLANWLDDRVRPLMETFEELILEHVSSERYSESSRRKNEGMAERSPSFRVSGAVALPVRGSVPTAIPVVHNAVFVESNHACDCASRNLLDHQHVPVIDSSQIEVPGA